MTRGEWAILAVALVAVGCGSGGAPAKPSKAGNRKAADASTAGAIRADGAPCESAEDCVGSSSVCDPKARVCKPAECDPARTSGCGTGSLCLEQNGSGAGACYSWCGPFGSGCSDPAADCIALALDNTTGICLPRGLSDESEPCASSLVSTGCLTGMVCVARDGGSVCKRACNFFSQTIRCPDGERCSVDGVCSALGVNSARLGEDCLGAAEGDYCGDDGQAARGVCVQEGATTRCHSVCRTGAADCGGGSHRCVGVFADAPELGACFDGKECGDGGREHTDCAACMSAEAAGCCILETKDCQSDKGCTAAKACVDECNPTDAACRDACIANHLDAFQPLHALISCLLGDALQDFQGACGSICR